MFRVCVVCLRKPNSVGIYYSQMLHIILVNVYTRNALVYGENVQRARPKQNVDESKINFGQACVLFEIGLL